MAKAPQTMGAIRNLPRPGRVTVEPAEDRTIDPWIPWRSGNVDALDVPAGKTLGGAKLGPGKWAMRPDSTVPFVTLEGGILGSRTITWGEVIEIPSGRTATIRNASAHSGDVHLASVGANSAPARPKSIVIPANVFVDGLVFRTREVDTRMVRRAFLMAHQLDLTGGLAYTVIQRGRRRGEQFATTTAAAGAGNLTFTKTVTGDIQYLDLGNGSGTYLDTAGNNAPDTVPHALLDTVQVEVADGNPADFNAVSDLFFVLEYG